ncbi:MAG: hypothetical protein DWI28_05290 [Planctomycetota bacterium]|nr:MAG: hypothetical protein DWI28_05290 [Planctomycetota bacterium]
MAMDGDVARDLSFENLIGPSLLDGIVRHGPCAVFRFVYRRVSATVWSKRDRHKADTQIGQRLGKVFHQINRLAI